METLYDVLWFTTAKQSVTNLNLIRTRAVITVSVTARQSTAVDACWGSVGGFGYRITLLKWQGGSRTAGGHAVAKHTWEAWGGCLIADSDNLNALSKRWILNLRTNLFQWLLQAYLWLVSSCCLGSEILKIKGGDYIEAYKSIITKKTKEKTLPSLISPLTDLWEVSELWLIPGGLVWPMEETALLSLPQFL